MKQHAADLRFRTDGEVEVRNLTGDLARVVGESRIALGQALLSPDQPAKKLHPPGCDAASQRMVAARRMVWSL